VSRRKKTYVKSGPKRRRKDEMMNQHSWMVPLLLIASAMAAPASDQPNATRAQNPPTPVPSAAQARPAMPRAGDAAAPKAKANPGRRKVSAAEAARSRAMLDAAIDAQGRQVIQAESARQAAIRAEEYRLQNLNAQQLDAIRRLTPRGVTVSRYNANGQLDINTYYFQPSILYPVPPQP
jgi:hypothetical protein